MFISSGQASIEAIVSHSLLKNEGQNDLKISKNLLRIDATSEKLLLRLLVDNFKVPEFYHFRHSSDQLKLNPVFSYIREIFEQKNAFIDQSSHIVSHLWECSTHPNIKSGDVMIAYIRDIIVEDEILDAVGIIKVENLEEILVQDDSSLRSQTGIDVGKIDKGCLIFNTMENDGFKILNIDHSNTQKEALYWRENFLNITPLKNGFQQTTHYIQATRSFMKDRLLDGEILEKTEQISIMKRSQDYFKHHEQFSEEEYAINVFKNDAVADAFKEYKETYASEKSTQLLNDFEISDQAVKRQSKVFKSIIKLDKNFHIYVHGDRNLIQKGVDDNGKKYYVLYYDNEI